MATSPGVLPLPPRPIGAVQLRRFETAAAAVGGPAVAPRGRLSAREVAFFKEFGFVVQRGLGRIVALDDRSYPLSALSIPET